MEAGSEEEDTEENNSLTSSPCLAQPDILYDPGPSSQVWHCPRELEPPAPIINQESASWTPQANLMETTSQLRFFFLDDSGLCQIDKNQAAPKYNLKLSYFATFLLFSMTDAFSVLLYENVLSNTALGSAPPIHLCLCCNF